MKEHVDRLFGKLRSSKGETLAELLVSVLVIVLGLTMFATAMMSSKKMLVKGDAWPANTPGATNAPISADQKSPDDG